MRKFSNSLLSLFYGQKSAVCYVRQSLLELVNTQVELFQYGKFIVLENNHNLL